MKAAGKYPAKRRLLWTLIFVILTFCCILDVFYYRKVQEGLLEQTYRDLEKENNSARSQLEGRIRARQEWLKMIASFCDVPDGSGEENWWDETKEYCTEGSRLGIGDTKGSIYYGNHQSVFVGDKPYYKEIMAGKSTISGILSEEYNEQDSIVIGVPIFRGGRVRGAVCMEYTVLELGNTINNPEMNLYGANLAFNSEGKMTASYPGMEEYGTLYDMLDTMEHENREEIEQLKASVKAGESGFHRYYNKGKMRLLYYQPAGVRDWTIASLVVADDYERIFRELRLLSVIILTVTTLLVVAAVVLTGYALKIRKKDIEKINKDALTGVFTREAALQIIRREFGKKDGGAYRTCLFLDIDHFKDINDTRGHDAGDKVLIETGQILERCMRNTDIISRYGGDEFCIWVYGKSEREILENIAERILQEYRKTGTVSVSIGIAAAADGETSYETVMKQADQALYKAKLQGRNRYVLYEP